MNTFLNKFTIPLVLALLGTSIAHANLVREDNFEQGKWASFWGAKTGVTVTSNAAKDGAYSARFFYPARPDGGDGWSELRFDLGNYYNELAIQFDLYIPANYEHRNSDGPDNNKFFRLWSETYNDKEKVGASIMPQGSGESRIGSDYRKTAAKGVSTAIVSANDFITSKDYGKWVKIVIYIKAATDTNNFILKIYKNGALHLSDSHNNNYVAGTQGYRRGYLLGWSNSGFNQDTVFYIDNVKFHDMDIMINAPMPPSQISIQ